MKPHEWFQWLPPYFGDVQTDEFCYNTSLHTSTRKTPFEVVYGRAAPSLLNYIPETAKVEAINQTLQERNQILQELRSQLQQT